MKQNKLSMGARVSEPWKAGVGESVLFFEQPPSSPAVHDLPPRPPPQQLVFPVEDGGGVDLVGGGVGLHHNIVDDGGPWKKIGNELLNFLQVGLLGRYRK